MANIIQCRAQTEPSRSGDSCESRQQSGGEGTVLVRQQSVGPGGGPGGRPGAGAAPGGGPGGGPAGGTDATGGGGGETSCPFSAEGGGEGGEAATAQTPAPQGPAQRAPAEGPAPAGGAEANAEGTNGEANRCGPEEEEGEPRRGGGRPPVPPPVQPIGIETPKPLAEVVPAEVTLALAPPLVELSLAGLAFPKGQTEENADTERQAIRDVQAAYAGVRREAEVLIGRQRADGAAWIAGLGEAFAAVDEEMHADHLRLDDRLLVRHQGLVFDLHAHREQALLHLAGGRRGARMGIYRARNAGNEALQRKLDTTDTRITEIIELAILPFRLALDDAVSATRTEIDSAVETMTSWRTGIDRHFPLFAETRMEGAANEGKRETARCRVDEELPKLRRCGEQLTRTFDGIIEPFEQHARQNLEQRMRAEGERARRCGFDAIQEAADRSVEAVDQSHDAGRDWIKSQAAASERQLTQMLNAARGALRDQVEAKRNHLRQEAEQGRRRIAESHDNQQLGLADALTSYRDSVVSTVPDGQAAFRSTGTNGAGTTRETLAELARRFRDGGEQIEEGARTGLKTGHALFSEETGATVDRQQYAAWQALADARVRTDDGVGERIDGMRRLKDGVEQTANQWSMDYAERFSDLIDQTWEQIDACEPVFQGRVDAKRDEIDEWVSPRQDPDALFESDLEEVAGNVLRDVGRRVRSLDDELEDTFVDDKTVVAAVRGLTWAQGRAVKEGYEDTETGPGGSLYDDIADGVSGDDLDAAFSYLLGNQAEGAEYELRASIHWYNDDEQRIRDTLRSLDDDQLTEFIQRDGVQSTIDSVRGNLGGVDRRVFDTLISTDFENNETRLAHADAQDLEYKLSRAHDRDAVNRELTEFYSNSRAEARGYGSRISNDQLRRLINDRMAHVRNVTDDNGEIVSGEAADAVIQGLADERVEQIDRMRCQSSGHCEEHYRGAYGDRLRRQRGAQRDLTAALISHGVGSVEERTARLGIEITRGGGARMENVDQYLVDPRLSANRPELDVSRYPDGQVPPDVQESLSQGEARALAERMELLSAVASRYGDARSRSDGGTAAEQVADLLGRGQSDLGQRVIEGLVNNPFPSAETSALIFEYSARGPGTNEALMKQAARRLNRDQIADVAAIYDGDYPSLWDLVSSETSGQDFLDMELAWMGRPRNARERAEVALFASHQQRREAGSIGADLVAGTRTERRFRADDDRLRQLVGDSVSFSRPGEPPRVTIRNGNFDEEGRYTGEDRVGLDVASSMLRTSAENYAKNIDEWASAVTTTIAIIGAVIATVVTGGGASPLLAAAIAGGIGLSSMAANHYIRGGRYGWEEALNDLGMTAVQMLTAGLGQKLQAVAQASKTMGPIQQALLPAVVTGGLDSLGQTALNEATWQNGFGEGIGELLAGTTRGALTSTVAVLGTQALQKIPIGRAAGAVDDLAEGAGDVASSPGWRTLGDVAGESTNALSRSAAQSLSSGSGAFLSRGAELGFESLRGKYHGDAGDFFTEMSKSGGQAALQGIGEGAGEALRDRHRIAFGFYTRPGWMDPGDYQLLRDALYGSGADSVPDSTSGTAAGIAGSRFRGDLHDAPMVRDTDVDAGISALTGDGGPLQGRVRPDPDGAPGRALIDLDDGGSVEVRFRVVDDMAAVDGEVPVARFDPRPEGGFEVRVSSRADPELIRRALAHELTEIRALRRPDAAQRVADGDLLRPGSGERSDADTPPRLSPHDEGRIAEVEWVARQIEAEEGRRRPDPERLERLTRDMDDLLGHLGVVGEMQGPSRRRELMLEHLGDPRLRGAIDEHAARANQIEESRLTLIGERRRAAAEGGLVDVEYQSLPDAVKSFLRLGERMPGRSQVPERIKRQLRAEARERFGRLLQEALLDPGKHSFLTQASMERMSQPQLDHVLRHGELRRGVEFHHLLAVADFPEFAHQAAAGLGLPKEIHREAGHGMDTTRPLEAATFVDPDAETRPQGLHNDPEAQKYYRPRQREIAEGTRSRGDVDRDLVTDYQDRVRRAEGELRRREAIAARHPTERNIQRRDAARTQVETARAHLAEVQARIAHDSAMREQLLRHIPPEQRAQFADTPIRILSDAQFRALTESESGSAVTLIRDSEPVVVVREGAPIASLADEGPHLMQARDSATQGRVARLDEATLARWHDLDLDTQIDLFRTKIDLEIDAHRRIEASLRRGTPLDTAALARNTETLRNLDGLRRQVDALGPAERAGIRSDPALRPQYLDQPARLFSKKARGERRVRTVFEPLVGPSLASPAELRTRYPGAEVIAAEGNPRFTPTEADIARFEAGGGDFIAERFGESLANGSIDQMRVRFPLPHEKAMDNPYLDAGNLAPEELARAGTALLEQQETLTNLAPHALRVLREGGEIEIVYKESTIEAEVQRMADLVWTDPETDHSYRFEILDRGERPKGEVAPHSGFGVSGAVTDVTDIPVVTMRKVRGAPPEAERERQRTGRTARKQQERESRRANAEQRRQRKEEQAQAEVRREQALRERETLLDAEQAQRLEDLAAGRITADEDEQRRLSALAAELDLDLDGLVGVIRQFREESGGTGRRWGAQDIVDSLRSRIRDGRPPRYGDLDGLVAELSVELNAIAVEQMRDRIKASGPDAVLAVERGGAFLADVLSRGQADFPETKAVPKHQEQGEAGKTTVRRTPNLEAEIRRRIDDGQSHFAIVDVYMGGAFAGELGAMIRRIAEDHPDVEFDVLWLRETTGFERVTDALNLGDLEARERPAAATDRPSQIEAADIETRIRVLLDAVQGPPIEPLVPGDVGDPGHGATFKGSVWFEDGRLRIQRESPAVILPPLKGHDPDLPIRTTDIPVDIVLGDDMPSALDPTSTKPVRIFDREGRVVREIPIGSPDPLTGEPLEHTVDIVRRLMQGAFGPDGSGGSGAR